MSFFSFFADKLDTKTPKLVAMLASSRRPLPDPAAVEELLLNGASPWGTNENGRGVLSLLIWLCPHPEPIDAWFKAAGKLSGAPWLDKNSPSPVRQVLEDSSQPEGFKSKLFIRLLEAGAAVHDIDTDGKALVERVHESLGQGGMFYMRALSALAKHHPESFSTRPARIFFEDYVMQHQSHDKDLLDLWVQAHATTLERQTPAVSAVGRKHRL